MIQPIAARIRLIGVCRQCRKPTAVEGTPVFEHWQELGKGLAAGKVFDRSGWKLPGVNGLTVNETGRKVKRTVWSGDVSCVCGHWASVESINGKVTDHKCGARCTDAFSGDCECECGGENHGKGFVVS